MYVCMYACIILYIFIQIITYIINKYIIIYIHFGIYIYIYIFIIYTIYYWAHDGTWCTYVHDVHHVPKCMSCQKAIVVTTGRAHCFHDCMYITPILLLLDLSTLCIVNVIWPLILYILYIILYIQYIIYIYMHIYIYICIMYYIIL